MRPLNRVCVIGAGAWGTALAGVAARAGRKVTLYARDATAAATISATRDNPRLPGIPLDRGIVVTHDLAAAGSADIVVIAVPAQHSRAAVAALAPHLSRGTPVIASAKGIEHGTRRFMTEVIEETAPHAVPAILSGPSFADDVARGLPTAVTLAAKDEALAVALVHALGSAAFRPYHTTDVRGVEIGGAAKNVLAIAAGIVVGKQLGASALALIGLFNIAGTFLVGHCGTIYPKRFLLAFIYAMRSVVIVAFLLAPLTPLSVYLFSAAIGMLWLSTVPPTNAIVAQVFGVRYFGMLSGFVFLSHQVGSFLGAWLGGKLFDATGSYDLVWGICIALGIIAALANLPIDERSLEARRTAAGRA